MADRYGIPVARLAVHPFGEEAYDFVADGRLLLRAQPAAEIDAALAGAAKLRVAGIREVGAPLRGRDGARTCSLGPHAVAALPVVAGAPLSTAGAAGATPQRLAEYLPVRRDVLERRRDELEIIVRAALPR